MTEQNNNASLTEIRDIPNFDEDANDSNEPKLTREQLELIDPGLIDEQAVQYIKAESIDTLATVTEISTEIDQLIWERILKDKNKPVTRFPKLLLERLLIEDSQGSANVCQIMKRMRGLNLPVFCPLRTLILRFMEDMQKGHPWLETTSGELIKAVITTEINELNGHLLAIEQVIAYEDRGIHDELLTAVAYKQLNEPPSKKHFDDIRKQEQNDLLSALKARRDEIKDSLSICRTGQESFIPAKQLGKGIAEIFRAENIPLSGASHSAFTKTLDICLQIAKDASGDKMKGAIPSSAQGVARAVLSTEKDGL